MPDVSRYLTLPLLITGLTLAGAANAADERGHQHESAAQHVQHGAHVHGLARLTFVIEGNAVQMELLSPAANIVGFEHAPVTEEDHSAIEKAVELLGHGDSLFRFSAAAGCRMKESTLDSTLLEAIHEEDHAHDVHEHDAERHADFEAAWRFECATPAALEQLDIGLFEAFPATEELQVEFIAGGRQQATAVTPANHVIRF